MIRVFLISLLLCNFPRSGIGGDWPMWRFDANRSAASTESLPEDLELIWRLPFSARRQAWDDPLNHDLMTYDRLLEPVVSKGRLFVGFNDQDKVSAFDTGTGQCLWTFYTEAPVRLAPAAWREWVFFCSDDGFLYCVDAKDGSLHWKFRGAPGARHALGNRRLTSAWPARGGPVIRDGTVYFAASIWPFMGTFLYAIDAETGSVVWQNSGSGAHYIKQPHRAPSFAGVAPQGMLVATGDTLFVPGGRSVPAAFDRSTGEFRFFRIGDGGKGNGGSFVVANDRHFYVHTRGKNTRAFHADTGIKTSFTTGEPVLTEQYLFAAEGDEKSRSIRGYSLDHERLWEVKADGSGDLILSGDHLFAAGKRGIVSLRLSGQPGESPAVGPLIPVEGQVERLLAADGKLFAVTLEGDLLAFGEKSPEKEISPGPSGPAKSAVTVSDEGMRFYEELIAPFQPGGYALYFGDPEPELIDAVAAKDAFEQFAVITDNRETVNALRRRVDASGHHGRITAHLAAPADFMAPPYVANLVIVSPEIANASGPPLLRSLHESVRPYGGVMILRKQRDGADITDRIRSLDLEQATVESFPRGTLLRKEGPLPGSADWTHQYGNVANTVKSDDERVKLPLGILWFGGSSNMDVLPRHGHGPPEQVVGGRLFIQGIDLLSARDVYTGRVLWRRAFDDLGTFDVYYDKTYTDAPLDTRYNQVHIPGANARGTNFVATDDRVYLLEGNVCHVLDPTDGKTLFDIEMPSASGDRREAWGFIGIYGDVLLGGQGFANYGKRHSLSFLGDEGLSGNRAGFGSKSLDRAASIALVGFDRHTGEQRWKVDAIQSFWHNGIVAGGGRVYCLDKHPREVEEALRRRGKATPGTYRIIAIDALTGKRRWELKDQVFGTWLGYSEEHDLLLQAGASASDRLYAEVSGGMAVYSGKDGSLRWKNETLKYAGPCMIHDDHIITNVNSYKTSAGAYSLLTGKQKFVRNPITGEETPWTMERAYGCNHIIASENLLTFRSGAAGFYDLLNDSGTGNFGGFKSGCTSNLVVANGVLNAPDYTRTCSCAYQNQTSLALVHMPDLELWTNNHVAALTTGGSEIDRLGINFGAPGDRRDPSGMIWLEYPVAAGSSLPLDIAISPEPRLYRQHASAVSAPDGWSWVLASGIRGETEIRVPLGTPREDTRADGIPIRHSDDDAEERDDGRVNLTSSDLELVEDGRAQLVGMRFSGIPLARNTEIRRAWIQFTCDEKASKPTELLIRAQQSGDAAPFTEMKHDLSHRPKTRNAVEWTPAAWSKVGESGSLQRTPDLSDLIRPIVNHPDWKEDNALAFFIEGEGKRVAESSNGSTKEAPRLFVETGARDPESGDEKGRSSYRVSLYFGAPESTGLGRSVFDVSVQNRTVLERVTIDPDGKPEERFVVETLSPLLLGSELRIHLIPREGEPLLSGISVERIGR